MKIKKVESNSIGSGNLVPPLFSHVKVYFDQKGYCYKEAEAFFSYFSSQQWKNSKGTTIKNWKEAAWRWIWHKLVQYTH